MSHSDKIVVVRSTDQHDYKQTKDFLWACPNWQYLHTMRQLRICRSFCLNFKPVVFFCRIARMPSQKSRDNFVELLISEMEKRWQIVLYSRPYMDTVILSYDRPKSVGWTTTILSLCGIWLGRRIRWRFGSDRISFWESKVGGGSGR